MYFHSECTNIIKQNQTSCLEEYPLHYSVFYLHILVLPVFKLHINGIMQNVFLFLNLWFFLLALCLRCTEIDAVAVFHDFHSQVVLMVKNPPANTGDIRDKGSIPGSGRPPGVGNGNPLQYSCLGNSKSRGAWWTTVRGVTKSQTQLSN